MNVHDIYDFYYKDDIDAMDSWCADIYNKDFAPVFNKVRSVYEKFQFASTVISDEDLEWIIVSLPMELLYISESLNSLRLKHEVLKLKNKKIQSELEQRIWMESQDVGQPITKKELKESVEFQMVEHKIMMAAFLSVITRVENEITFSKELIMGAKKVWDSRRHGENSNPIGEVDVNEELPEYTSEFDGKYYIG